MQYQIGWQNMDGKRFAVVKIVPKIKNREVVYKIEAPGEGWERCSFLTATTGMKDWIGNIREIIPVPEKDEIFCTIEGVYEGRMTKIRGVKWRADGEPKLGQRVMVTEHLNVAGGFDMLATTSRILDLGNPNLNFVNIGWGDGKECRYLRIDPYTGEQKECAGAHNK